MAASAAALVALVSYLRRGQVDRAAVLADRAVVEAEGAADAAVLAEALTVRMGVHIQRGSRRRPWPMPTAPPRRRHPLWPCVSRCSGACSSRAPFGRVEEAADRCGAIAAEVHDLGDDELTFRLQNNWGLMLLRSSGGRPRR